MVVNRPGSTPTLGTVTCFAAAGGTTGAIIAAIACEKNYFVLLDILSDDIVGPFELTKLSAQISVLMAKSNTSSVDDPVRRSYQQKGTFRTAKNIVMHRGISGLYSGFNYHLRKLSCHRIWSAKPNIDIALAVRDTIGTAIYFTVYESGKQLSVKFQGSSSPTSPLSVAMAGGLCGLVSWACVSLPVYQDERWLHGSINNNGEFRSIQLTRPKPTTSGIV